MHCPLGFLVKRRKIFAQAGKFFFIHFGPSEATKRGILCTIAKKGDGWDLERGGTKPKPVSCTTDFVFGYVGHVCVRLKIKKRREKHAKKKKSNIESNHLCSQIITSRCVWTVVSFFAFFSCIYLDDLIFEYIPHG